MESTLSFPSSRAEKQTLQPPPDLDTIFSRYLDPVYRFFYTRVGNREDAEDLTSEVFLKATRQLDSDRSEASVAQWLFTVARTVLADHWRRYYKGGNSVPLDDDHPALPVSDSGASNRSERLVEQILGNLPERYRRVLELRFLLGFTIQETAREMGVTPENAKVLQHRALARAVQLSENRL